MKKLVLLMAVMFSMAACTGNADKTVVDKTDSVGPDTTEMAVDSVIVDSVSVDSVK